MYAIIKSFEYDFQLTHWGLVLHLCVGKLTSIGSDNGLSPGRRQAIIWTNAGILLIGPLGANICEILIEILTFSFKKMRFKVSSAKSLPQCVKYAIPWGLVIHYKLTWDVSGNVMGHGICQWKWGSERDQPTKELMHNWHMLTLNEVETVLKLVKWWIKFCEIQCII